MSLTWSITAVGLLPATLARLKKTPETITAAATVIAISSITATSGLRPADLLLCRIISFNSCVKSFIRLPFGVVLMYGVSMLYWILQPISRFHSYVEEVLQQRIHGDAEVPKGSVTAIAIMHNVIRAGGEELIPACQYPSPP
jgi:hypothetical protein